MFRNIYKLNFLLRTLCNPPLCPPVLPMAVTLIGGSSRVGQLTALQLKQCSLINELRLFEFKPFGQTGVAMDLNHIPLSTKVVSYSGFDSLRDAVTDAQVVVICGGEPPKPMMKEYELFLENADYVRDVALHTAEFNPNTILCISTPPVTAMVPLASEEYKRAKVYDPKKIIGVTTLGVTRTNSVIAVYSEQDPGVVMCPLIGGMGTLTMVPVLSQTDTGPKLPTPAVELLHNKICKSEDEALSAKYLENSGPCMLSSAFATARFVTSVVQGLKDNFKGYECAFVRQTGHVEPFLSYMTSIIKLNREGVKSLHMPNVNDLEGDKLQKAAVIIRKQIKWGESYVTGELLEKKKRVRRPIHECEIIKLEEESRICDIGSNKCSDCH